MVFFLYNKPGGMHEADSFCLETFAHGFIRLPRRILASSRSCSLAITYFYLQWTTGKSNLQGKSKKVQVIGNSSYWELEENSRE